MKVLLAVDGSDCALRAARTLAEWAKTCNGTCAHVLNAQPVVPYMDLLGEARRDRVEAWVQELGRQTVQGACDVLAGAGVPFEVEVLESDAAPAIARIALERHCDFILMGSRGMSAIAGFALGSVAAKVVHLAGVPVTLVK